MDQELIKLAYKNSKQGRNYALATIIESTKKGTPRKAGAKMLVMEDGTSVGSIGGGRNELSAINTCLNAIKTGESSLQTYDFFGQKGQSVCGGQIKVFIDPILKNYQLIICGGGHIGLPLSILGKMIGFNVLLLDNRKDFANKTRFPHVDQVLFGDYSKKLDTLELNNKTAIMIVTQGNEFDFQCLEEVISKDPGYIGVISSKAKKVKFLTRLKNNQVKPSKIKPIHIPAGIDIGAQTPEEIAISISAELIKWKNNHLCGTDKFK